mmetsp:Transcript_10536/g.15212  ORF Transcript_10536/g.15212 Transcript_10536/m.15212 type:complete len:105 (+) Transcript_10536:119-433(+)
MPIDNTSPGEREATLRRTLGLGLISQQIRTVPPTNPNKGGSAGFLSGIDNSRSPSTTPDNQHRLMSAASCDRTEELLHLVNLTPILIFCLTTKRLKGNNYYGRV